MAYKTVDLRGKIPGNPIANQGTQKKTGGGILHYNGDPNGYTGVVSGQKTPLQVYVADANYHMSIDWGGGARANGIQYHYGIYNDTVYVLRNPDSILWHCGAWPQNADSTAANVPISANERVNARTLQTLQEFWDDEMHRQKLSIRKLKGHKEVSSTSCPGSLMNDFVLSYRKASISPTKPAPAPTPTPAPNVRDADSITGLPRINKPKIVDFAKKHGAKKYALDLIEQIYEYAPKKNIGSDFLSVQMLLETAFGNYTGDSRHYNPAGIKLPGKRADTPADFEIPATPAEGARMLVNHWCAVLQLDPIGTPHGRYAEAKRVYASKPKITKISQLGGGNWAMDPDYGIKIRKMLDEAGLVPMPSKPAPAPAPAPAPKPASPKPAVWDKQRTLTPPGFKPLAPRAGGYMLAHPTRYEWRTDVRDLIKRIYARWPNVHINTYVLHPGDDNNKWARDTVAFDIWGPKGRGDWLNLDVGNAICDYIWYDPNPPYIDWYIWQRRMWTRASGIWTPYGENEFTWHRDHVHMTFTGPYNLLR